MLMMVYSLSQGCGCCGRKEGWSIKCASVRACVRACVKLIFALSIVVCRCCESVLKRSEFIIFCMENSAI